MGGAMTVRPEVLTLAEFGPLPPEEAWDEGSINDFAAAIAAVTQPLSGEERDALLPLFDRPSDDSVWGVAWGVLHLLETAPDDGWQLRLPRASSYWYDLLVMRWANSVSDPDPR